MKKRSLEEKTVELFCSMQKKILQKEHPFEEYPSKFLDNSSYLKCFMEHYDEIDEELKKRFLATEIRSLNQELRYSLLADYKSFSEEIIQEIDDNRDEVIKFLKENEFLQEQEDFTSTVKHKINVNKILKKAFAENKPEFIFKEGKAFKGCTKFSKEIGNENRIYILVDRGSFISKLNFSVGFEKPLLHVDLFLLFPGVYEHGFLFDSPESLENKLDKFFKICDIILPYIEDNIPR